MNNYVTGTAIKELREKKKLLQKELAEMLGVSDKTISKWETGRGLPDISLLEPLAGALGVSLTELLSGQCIFNENRSANLLRSKWYICPVCGNTIWSSGEGTFSCCGVHLIPASAEQPDEAHEIHVQRVEDEWYITLAHPMTKTHAIRFLAYVTCDRVQMVRLYPEQNAEARFSRRGSGRIYAYCNRHGLFEIRTAP